MRSPLPVEGERVADERPRDGRDRDRGDAHHERVERVLRAHEARVEEPERRRHQQHQRGGGEHPGGVAGVDLGGRAASGCRSGAHRRHGAVVGLAGADADRPARAGRRRSCRRRPRRSARPRRAPRSSARRTASETAISKRTFSDEPHLHGRAAVGLDPVELAAVALHAAHREPAHLGAVERFQHVVRLLRPDDPDHELHRDARKLTEEPDDAGRATMRRALSG